MKNAVTKSISLSPELLKRIEKVMALLHTDNFSYVATLALVELAEKKGC